MYVPKKLAWMPMAALLVFAILLASACAQPAPPAAEMPAEAPVEVAPPAEAEQRPIVVLVGGNPDTFDPAHQSSSIGLIRNVFDTLLAQDAEGNLQPNVATEWSRIAETTWEFKIRDDIVFHHGTPLTAKDVAYSLNRVLDPEIGARGHYLWLAGNMRLERAEAVDDYTVHLHTNGPSPAVPEYLWTWYILPQDHYSTTPLEELARAPLGSGPFKFVSWVPGEAGTIVANEEYWRGAPDAKTIIFRIVPELSSRIAEFNTGAADIMIDAPPPDLQSEIDPAYGRVENIESQTRVILGIVFYRDPAMLDKRVRQAMNYGVDVQRIIDSLLLGQGRRVASFANPPNVHPDLQPYPYDPEKARELLAEAGYVDLDGDGFVNRPDGTRLELTIMTPRGRWVKDYEVSQAVAADLMQTGVYVEVETREAGLYSTMLAENRVEGEFWFQMPAGGYGCQADLSDFSKATQWHPGGWEPGVFDEVFDELTMEADEGRRLELCYQLQEIMYEEVPLIFLYNLVRPVTLSNRVEWTMYPHGRNDFFDMQVHDE